jgi:hypothetical protein
MRHCDSSKIKMYAEAKSEPIEIRFLHKMTRHR